MRIVCLFSLSILLFIFYADFAQTYSDLEQKLRNMGIEVTDSLDFNQLMQKYREIVPNIIDEANIKAGKITGITGMYISSRPADTPEKEIERRREIINSQYQLARQMLGGIPEGEENPQIVEAIPVEGYILVRGGEKVLWYNNQIKRDISYTIKETFEGNLLVIHTYNIHTGKFEKEKEYALDTLSTNIKINNFIGKTCTKWSSGSPTVCLNWASYLLYQIGEAEIYPNFHSGVVSINQIDKGKIEIQAATPDISFHAKDGLTTETTHIGCTSGSWKLTNEEFEKLINFGAVTLKKEIGSKSQAFSSCIPGSTMTLYLKIKKAEPEKCREPKNVKIEILKPSDKGRYEFTDDGNTGRLILELEAKTYPAKYENSIEWEIPEMEGSHRIIQPATGSLTLKGPKAEVMYKGLPPDIESFGRKKVKAKVNVDGCMIEDTKEIMFFYPRDAKNNPEGKYPNWFYYWKQTPAAMPFGQNVNIVFGGTEFDLCKGEHVMAIYKPDYLFKAIHICNLTEKVGGDFKVTIPLVSRNDSSTLSEKKLISYTHIDTFAVLVIHEFTHFNHYHTWLSGKSPQQRNEEDNDGDGIPDRLEPDMKFDPKKFQTYWGEDEEFKNINGDEEFLAYESTYNYPIGKFDEYDWGKPGKNWK